jgi:hypothetical protein
MSGKKSETLQQFIRSRGVVQELNPTLARVAIQGFQDELAPAQRADDAFYRQFACPSCGSRMGKEFLGGASAEGVTWVEGEATPKALLRCTNCSLLMNPHTGMIVEAGHQVTFDDPDADLDPGVHR